MSITIKKGVGAPTTNTAGFIGEIYEDTNTGNRFECTGMYKTTGATAYGPDYDYIWEKIDVIPEKFLPEGMGGGASSWNDLKDKPFYDETVVYYEYVDGYTPIESVEAGDGQYLYKVSNTPLTKAELIGTELMFVSPYGDFTETINEVDESTPNVIMNIDGTIISVSADVSADGVTLTTGLWVIYAEEAYLSKVYKPSIKKLDAKFLPDELKTTINEYIDSVVDERINVIIEEALGGAY